MSNTLKRRYFIQSLLIFLRAGASIKSKLIFASKPDKNLKEKESLSREAARF
jgi:hypothetical protein